MSITPANFAAGDLHPRTTKAICAVVNAGHDVGLEHKPLVDLCRELERDRATLVRAVDHWKRENAALREVLDDMVNQFAYISKGRRHSAGLSALEGAFVALGLSDPHPAPAHLLCDEPGCGEESTCGTPIPGGYRRTCHKHIPKVET